MRHLRLLLLLGMISGAIHAQDLGKLTSFSLFGRKAQMHGFLSQGFSYTDQNNWLTMQTSKGSFAMTEGGLNLSLQLADKFRVGAQVYSRNFGNLGQWHPQLDWGFADYRFANWFGIRGGKVKTVLGLYNDTQDMDFLHTFALLPQSVYSTDMRDGTIAHTGGDVYGDIRAGRMGVFSYTVYAGHREDSQYGGYPYSVESFNGVRYSAFGGLQYGADLRWNTPVKGLLVGASRLDEDISASGHFTYSFGGNPAGAPITERSRRDYTNQFFGQYTRGNLKLDAEFRRYSRDHYVNFGFDIPLLIQTKAWYVAGAYRVSKRLEFGGYYSHLLALMSMSVLPSNNDPHSPGNHMYDKVVTARLDITSHWNLKAEGHFIDGYGNGGYPSGFYAVDNPLGLKPTTNGLIIRTGWDF